MSLVGGSVAKSLLFQEPSAILCGVAREVPEGIKSQKKIFILDLVRFGWICLNWLQGVATG
jgi:hypothetical protein